jgi:hypothetical protein
VLHHVAQRSAGRDITLLPRRSQAPLAWESGLTSSDATSTNWSPRSARRLARDLGLAGEVPTLFNGHGPDREPAARLGSASSVANLRFQSPRKQKKSKNQPRRQRRATLMRPKCGPLATETAAASCNTAFIYCSWSVATQLCRSVCHHNNFTTPVHTTCTMWWLFSLLCLSTARLCSLVLVP